jgi:hypothetical protein
MGDRGVSIAGAPRQSKHRSASCAIITPRQSWCRRDARIPILIVAAFSSRSTRYRWARSDHGGNHAHRDSDPYRQLSVAVADFDEDLRQRSLSGGITCALSTSSRRCFAPVYRRFMEGFATTDLEPTRAFFPFDGVIESSLYLMWGSQFSSFIPFCTPGRDPTRSPQASRCFSPAPSGSALRPA